MSGPISPTSSQSRLAHPRGSVSSWTDVLNADVAVGAVLPTNSGVAVERAASTWDAVGRRQSQIIPTANASLIHRLAQREQAPTKGYLGERKQQPAVNLDESTTDLTDEFTAVTRARSTSYAALPVHAGAVFPVRPNPVLLDNTTRKDDTLAIEPVEEMMDTEDRDAREFLKTPARTISSYLLKQGKTRKKWSRRYFTLLPAKFLLIYSHKKEKSGTTSAPGVSFAPTDADGIEEEDGSTLADGDNALVSISLKKFRLESDGVSQITLMVPEKEDGVLDDGRGVSGGLALLAGGSPSAQSNKEKKIELKAESKEILDEWMQELRRLQLHASYLQNYSAIISRNKVYAMQGRYDLLQNPNPARAELPLSLTHPLLVGKFGSTIGGKSMKQTSSLSLLTSALTGDVRSKCAKCFSTFHLLSPAIECLDCLQKFCTRPTCIMPRSYQDEGVDTFSVLHIGQQNKQQYAKPTQPRLCIDCERTRQQDPIYQKLLHGQLNLCLRICSASGLMAANLIDKTSDPYVKFSLAPNTGGSGGGAGSSKPQEYRTSCIEGTLNPVWEKDGEFNIPWSDTQQDENGVDANMSPAAAGAASPTNAFNATNQQSSMPRTICLEVWDRDRLSADDFLGCVYLPVSDLEKNVLYDDHFPLRSRKEDVEEKECDLLAQTSKLASSMERLIQGGKKRITGTLHLQVILTTASYTADLLKILPSLQGLGRKPPTQPIPKGKQLASSPSAGSQTPRGGGENGHSIFSAQGAASSSSSSLTTLPAAAPSPPPIQQAISSFLAGSHLHSLLLRALEIVLSLQLGWWSDLWTSIHQYESPFWSLVCFILWSLAVWKFPASWILPCLPFLLLIHLISNLMEHALSKGQAAIDAIMKAEEAKEHELAVQAKITMKAQRKASSVSGQLNRQLKSFAGGLFKGFNKSKPAKIDEAASPTAASTTTVTPGTKGISSGSPSTPSISSTMGPQGELPSIGEGDSEPSQSHPALPTPTQTPRRNGPDLDTPLPTPRSMLPDAALSDQTPVQTPRSLLGTTSDSPGSSTSLVPSSLSLAGDSPSKSDAALAEISDRPLTTTTDDGLDEEERAGSIVFRMRKLKRQVRTVQQLVDAFLDALEEAVKLWNWKDVDKSQRFCRACIVLFALAYYFSFRWLLFFGGVYKFTQHPLKVHRRISSMKMQKSNLHLAHAARRQSKMQRRPSQTGGTNIR